MENFIFSINVTIPIFLVMVLGWGLKQIGMLNDNFVTVANKFNFKVTLPFLLFRDLSSVDIKAVFDLKYVLFCAIASSVCFWVIWGGTKLFMKDKTKVKPLIYGGGQQKGMRSGTENVPGVAALGEASAEIYENFEEKIDHLYALKSRFIDGVSGIEGVTVNGKTGRDSAPQIVSVSIDGVRSEVMLHTLEDRGIYVSAGSACSSNKPSVSHTLTSIGLKGNLLDSTIRFSFSVHTTEEEIDYAISVMSDVIPKLRRYTRH